MKQCRRCPTPRPKSDFYRNHQQRDGLTTLCKEHQKEAVRKSQKGRQELRRQQRALKARNKQPKARRKASVISRMHLTPMEKVILAMRRGTYTREGLFSLRIEPDVVCDILATLWDEGKLDTSSLKRREYRMAA